MVRSYCPFCYHLTRKINKLGKDEWLRCEVCKKYFGVSIKFKDKFNEFEGRRFIMSEYERDFFENVLQQGGFNFEWIIQPIFGFPEHFYRPVVFGADFLLYCPKNIKKGELYGFVWIEFSTGLKGYFSLTKPEMTRIISESEFSYSKNILCLNIFDGGRTRSAYILDKKFFDDIIDKELFSIVTTIRIFPDGTKIRTDRYRIYFSKEVKKLLIDKSVFNIVNPKNNEAVYSFFIEGLKKICIGFNQRGE